MRMLLEYENEIIGLLTILVLLIIYLVLKIQKLKQSSTAITLEEPQEQTPSEQKEQAQSETSATPKKEIQEKETEELEGSLEGEFTLAQSQEPKQNKRKSDIFKRNVPKHGKITKENFKEFAGVRILVAEDNIINQKVISGLLAESGIELVMVDDGQEAIDKLQEDSDFLMILMDAHMPRVDGFEATRIIRANPEYSHIVVVALSGDTAADDIKKMQEAGMAEQLEKPLRMDSLYDVLYAYSGSGSQKDEQNETDTVEVPLTKELDGEKGLAICGGDEKFYLEILYEFVDTYAQSAHTLRDYLTKSQIQKADKLLLDVIGVGANIGAQRFTDVATHLKESLHDTDEKSYFTNLEQYQAHLNVLIQDIKDFAKR